MKRPDSQTLASLLDEMADRQGDSAVVIDEAQSRSYTELRDRADRIAASLRHYGVGADDRVAILMENRVEWVETLFAAERLGASVVGVSSWAQPRELKYFLSHSGAKMLVSTAAFAGTNFADTLEDILEYESNPVGELDSDVAPDLETVAFLGTDRPGAATYESLLEGDAISFDTDPNEPMDEALLLYTSGSTSKPKGVPLLHDHIIENSYHIGERLSLTPSDRTWLASPLFWSYGTPNALCATMTHGGAAVLQAPFDGEKAVELMDDHDCTVYYGMPNMARGIVDADGFDTDRVDLRTGTTIGSREDVAYTMDELDVPELCNVYGSTETYGNCAVTDCDLPREVRLETQGKPLPGQDIKIVDEETGEELPQGEVGEIRVGGRITPGYHDNPEKNRQAFDDEGYLKTGDTGRLTEEGRLQFRGRLKNMIKTGGINVSPVEVEEFLLEHPAIDQAYVIGLDDPEQDEIVAAAIVPVAGASLDLADVEEHCQGLAAYKRPTEVRIVEARDLPSTDTDKIKRSEIGALFESD